MKKKLINTVASIVAMASSLLIMSQPAMATSLSYTDIVQSPGDNINYSLEYNLSTGNTYNATFTVSHDADTTPEWYAAWFTFNFTTGNHAATISNLVGPSGTGPWSVLDSSTQVLKGGGNYGSPLDTGAAGFYVTSIKKPAPDYPDTGIWVTGPLATTTPETFTFDFTTNGGTLHDGVGTNDMPFKVGYYDKKTGDTKWTVNRLSAGLDGTQTVPEPSTILLLGSGLIGLAGFARRLRK